MTRLEHTDCPRCAHMRSLERYGGTPTCAKAAHPHGGDAQQACVVSWDRCLGKHFEARR